MADTGNAREIEVRSLNGESIRLSIEPDKTVADLKLLLKHRFSPASSSHNFHLFLKGVKLNMQSKIGSYLIGDGDFLVIIPYLKKDKQQIHRGEASEMSSTILRPQQAQEAKMAESAWSDLMQDLSSMQGVSNCDDLPEAEPKSLYSINVDDHVGTSKMNKRRRVLISEKERGTQSDVLLSILQECGSTVFDAPDRGKFLEYMDNSSCLTDPATGFCVMRQVV